MTVHLTQPAPTLRPRDRTGLVLSGGGARGAYEVGVMVGLTEILGGSGPAPFSIFTGTSVGALNGTWLAAHADRADMQIDGLIRHWMDLRIDRHLRLRPLPDLLRLRRVETWSVLDNRDLASLMTSNMPWDRLHANVDGGVVSALAVACLEIASGRTTIFAEVGPRSEYAPTRDPSRASEVVRLGAEHILASTALPFLFPAVRVGDAWFADGGLRFNTPIAPALRMGADRLMVVSLLFGGAPVTRATLREYPTPAFLAGKTLNALLLDPIVHDIAVLERFNRLWGVLERVLDAEALAEVNRVVTEDRGAPYRTVETLVFRPSKDIGAIAARHARSLRAWRPATWLLNRMLQARGSDESDLMSFLLFDHRFAEELIELGRADALARRDEVSAFFDAAPATPARAAV